MDAVTAAAEERTHHQRRVTSRACGTPHLIRNHILDLLGLRRRIGCGGQAWIRGTSIETAPPVPRRPSGRCTSLPTGSSLDRDRLILLATLCTTTLEFRTASPASTALTGVGTHQADPPPGERVIT